MLGEKFTLDIRPTFIDELDRTVAYIEWRLRNPQAADKLIADTYAAIDETLAHLLVTAPKHCPPDVRQPYYTIPVGNYVIYYIVRDHVMEVRWFRYSKSTRGLVANPIYETVLR